MLLKLYCVLMVKQFVYSMSSFENKLTDKANKTGTGIKHNKIFGDANYNVLKIKRDNKKWQNLYNTSRR